jgi:S-DNA-T family DNA segregation ATPase FtsK/SpoIIIE
VGEIARLGRAVGVHLILCTQRPDAEAVPGQLKANLAGTIAFRVRSEVNSHILLESDGAALLPHHPGRAIWAHERLEEFQVTALGGVGQSRSSKLTR